MCTKEIMNDLLKMSFGSVLIYRKDNNPIEIIINRYRYYDVYLSRSPMIIHKKVLHEAKLQEVIDYINHSI
jgi:hypothetical protein